MLVWAYTQRDADGYLHTGAHNFSTPSYALESDDLDIGSEGPDWLFEEGRLAKVRIEGASMRSTPIFVGIGPKIEVDAYLRGVGHAIVRDVNFDPFRYRPAAARWPAAGATGTAAGLGSVGLGAGRQRHLGRRRGELGGRRHERGRLAGGLLPHHRCPRRLADLGATIGILVLGLLVLLAGAVMLFFGARGGPATQPTTAAPALPVPAGDYPVRAEARLDDDLSRRLWLVSGCSPSRTTSCWRSSGSPTRC